ncbi:MAG: PTS sugar transporter subunit IIA [Erysipelotrichaceae bacterium]|nr:PTS sugar transporter subunit IIA [Erysipelotrichaceae bacterium]
MNKEFIRRNKFVNLLAQQTEYKPASFYSGLLKISEKTVYGDIEVLNDKIAPYGLFIEKSPRKGLRLVGSAQDIEQYLEMNRIEEGIDYSPIHRQRKLAQMIFLTRDTVNINDVEKQMYISRNRIKNDIQVLKKYFLQKGVDLVLENNVVVAEGKERDIQNAYQNYEIDYFKKNDMLTFTEISMEMKSCFEPAILNLTHDMVESFSTGMVKGLSEAYSTVLYFSLCVMFTRVKNGYHIKEDTKRFVFQDMENMVSYMLAMNCSMQLSDKLGIIMDNNDIRFLSEILISYGIEPTVHSELIGQEFKDAVTRAIERMSQLLETDLTDDTKLYDSLLAHVVPMIYRLKNGFLVNNPLLSSIKRQYMVMFTLTWYVSAVFEDTFRIKVNDDEVSFLTIYFQVSFAKKSKPKNILIVCPNGMATSELVYSQIKDILHTNDHIEVTTIGQVLANDVKDVEFIISLVQDDSLKNIGKKIFYVSPVITQDELSEISQYYGSVNQKRSRLRNVGKVNLVELTKYFDDDFLYWQYDLPTKEQVLDFMVRQYEKHGFVTDDFRDSVYTRESEGETTISTTVAMPHAATKTVRKSVVSIMTLQKSIKWGKSEADTIIMIAVSDDDVDEIRGIISKLYDLVENKQEGNLLTQVRSNEQFALLLQDVSRKEEQ